MTWRAHIDDAHEFTSYAVRLLVADVTPNGTKYLASADNGFTSEKWISAGERPPDEIGFTLPSDALHAILAALSRHLGAVEHPEQLRRDYDAERKRVDTLIAALIGRTP